MDYCSYLESLQRGFPRKSTAHVIDFNNTKENHLTPTDDSLQSVVFDHLYSYPTYEAMIEGHIFIYYL